MTEDKLVPELRFPEFNGVWQKKELGSILDFKNGLNKGKDFFGKGTPIVNYMDVNRNKHLLKKDIEGLVTVNDSEKERFKVIKGDTFFTRTSETVEEIGLASVVIEDIKDCVYSGFILRGRNKTKSIDMIFSGYFYNTENVRKEIMRKSSKTTRALTNGTLLSEVELIIPDLEEQEKIGRFFYKIDKKIDLQEELIENLEEQKKGLMQKIFNQEVRFKDENGKDYPEWEEKRLGDFTKVIASNLRLKDLNSKGETPVYDVSNKVGYIDKKGVGKDYISIIKDGSGVGRVSLLPRGSFFIATMNGIYVDKENIYFVYLLLKQFNFLKYIVGSGIPHIYYKDYSNEKIELPVIEEQKKISNFLSLADKRIDLEKEQLENYKEYKKGLMQRMFI